MDYGVFGMIIANAKETHFRIIDTIIIANNN